MWIDVYDPTGTTKQGDGPITTASEWVNQPVLDKAGTFSFSMPATDPRARLLQNKYQVWCYAIVNGTTVLRGAGIIDQITTRIDGNGSTLQVSGNDLLYELAGRSVASLQIKEDAWLNLDQNHGSVRWIGGSAEVDLTQAYDGNPATESAYFGIRDYWYLYIGFDMRFCSADFTLGSVNSSSGATLRLQYFSDTAGWVDQPITDNTTIVSGRPFAQNGHISWDMPADWARNTPTKAAGSWFWVRIFRAMGGNDFGISLKEVRVYAEQATTNGLSLIMALAPTGWTVSGHTTTLSPAYLQFGEESVLAALQKLADSTGEHFRLGTGRQIEWLQKDQTVSAIRAIGASGNAQAIADNPSVALIQNAEITKDTSSLYTRIRPYGSGTGSDRITLAQTTRTPPTGYTLNKTENWLRSDAAENTYGQIEAARQFSDILPQQKDSHALSPQAAADQLFDAALVDLKRHETIAQSYTITTVSCPAMIRPGEMLHVVYQKFVDGIKVIDINTYPSSPLWVLSATHRIDNYGTWTTEIVVSTIDRQQATDASTIVGTLQDVRAIQAQGSPGGQIVNISRVVSDEVQIKGGSIDGTPIGDQVPSSGRFTVLHAGSSATPSDGQWMINGTAWVCPAAGELAARVKAADTVMDFGQALTPGDFVWLQSGSADEFVQVGSLVSGTAYNVTRDLSGVGLQDWDSGTPWGKLGQSGDGRVTLVGNGTPRVMVIRQGTTYNDKIEIARLGDLYGWGDYTTHSPGLALGQYGSAMPNMVYDPTNGLRLRIGTTDKIRLGNDGNAYIAGILQIDSTGEIRQGSGTYGVDFTGMRIWQTNGIGQMAGYKNGIPQWSVALDGTLQAGGGSMVVNHDGIQLLSGDVQPICWMDNLGTATLGAVWGTQEIGYHNLTVAATNEGNGDAQLLLLANRVAAPSQDVNLSLNTKYAKATLSTGATSTYAPDLEIQGGLLVGGTVSGARAGMSPGQARFQATLPELRLIQGSNVANGHIYQASTGLQITYNASYDGAAWNRDDITHATSLIAVNETVPLMLRYAAAGANPVTWSDLLRVQTDGKVGVGTPTPTALLDVNSDTLRLRNSRTPASATATGNQGEICWASGYLYICVAANTWRRVALSSW